MKKLLWNFDKILRYFMTDNCFKGLVVPHTEKSCPCENKDISRINEARRLFNHSKEMGAKDLLDGTINNKIDCAV